MDIEIQEVKTVTPDMASGVDGLLAQLLHRRVGLEQAGLQRLVDTPNVFLFVALLGEQVVGTAELATYPRPYGPMSWVEGVVVDNAQRGKGIATLLMEAVLAKARELGLPEVNLTSNASRQAANHLYLKLGFERYETNYYRRKL